MGAAGAILRVGQARAHLVGKIQTVEFVMNVWVDMNCGARAASARSRHHLLAGLGWRPVVLRPDQNERRDACAPGDVAKPPATWVKRDRRAKIGSVVTRRRARAHRPQCGDTPSGEAEQRDAILETRDDVLASLATSLRKRSAETVWPEVV